MNAVTDKTFSLLKRISKQCEELNIPYFLGFRTAAYSMLDELPDNISHFEIFMFQWDIARPVSYTHLKKLAACFRNICSV